MPTSSTVRRPIPPTVWLARGRQTGPAAEDLLRANLLRLSNEGAVQDYRELPPAAGARERIFEARWQAPGEVTVRARLTLAEPARTGREWVLVAEAERPWNLAWPSPATLFWPDSPDAGWDHEAGAGLRLTDINPLPADEKELRRVLRHAGRGSWSINVVVHEAMTPDERGRRPLAPQLPPGLRHRVVEHRAAPQQLRVVNWALRDFGVEVPRGGAVVLPGTPAPPGYDPRDFSVRAVFLDGSEPVELIDAVTRFAALQRPLPEEADAPLTALREEWQLLTLEEQLERERRLVAMYAEALEAMTRSRDLYREAAERAYEALAEFRASGAGPAAARPGRAGSPLQQLTRTLERLKGLKDAARLPRPAAGGGAGTNGLTAGSGGGPAAADRVVAAERQEV
jgi:hypothetical protein